MVLKLSSRGQRNHCANSPINGDEHFKCLSINIKCVGSNIAAADPTDTSTDDDAAIKVYAESLNDSTRQEEGLRKGKLD